MIQFGSIRCIRFQTVQNIQSFTSVTSNRPFLKQGLYGSTVGQPRGGGRSREVVNINDGGAVKGGKRSSELFFCTCTKSSERALTTLQRFLKASVSHAARRLCLDQREDGGGDLKVFMVWPTFSSKTSLQTLTLTTT